MHYSSVSPPMDYKAILTEWIRITSARQDSVEKKILEILRLSRFYLQTDVAIVARVDGESYEIFSVDSPKLPIAQGQQFELALTYCEKTIQSHHVTSFHQACTDSLWSCHPAYKHFKLESYIGIPIHLDDGLFGTLGFSSMQARKDPFSTQEHDYVQMTARWIEHALESQKVEEHIKNERSYFQKTAQKARDEMLRSAQFQQQLIERITHDLRTPLEGLASMSHEIIHGASSVTQAKDRLRTINETSKHLLALLDTLSTTTSLQPRHSAPARTDYFSPYDVIEDIVSVLENAAKAQGTRLDVCLNTTLPEEVCGDLSRYRQVITNVINHSIRNSSGGSVSIQASLTDHTYDSRAGENDLYMILFEIEDTAPHLPSSIKPLMAPIIDRSFARAKPQKLLSSPAHQHVEDDLNHGSLSLDIAIYLLEMMEGHIEGMRSTEREGNLIRLKLPIRLTAASFEASHERLERFHIWTDTTHQPLKRALHEACERFHCRLVETLSEAHICLIDATRDDLDGRLTTYTQLATRDASFHLLCDETLHPTPALVQSTLDTPLRHRQLLELLRERSQQDSPTQELNLANLDLMLLDDDPAALLALHPSTDPQVPLKPHAVVRFEHIKRDRSLANLTALSRRVTDFGSSAIDFDEEMGDCAHDTPTIAFEEPHPAHHHLAFHEPVDTSVDKSGERTIVGVPGSLSFTPPVLFDRSIRERHQHDTQALRLYDTLLQEFFIHSARWLTEIRDCTNARIMQKRLHQDLLEIKETAREIGLLAVSQLCFQLIKDLQAQSLTRFTMLKLLDELSASLTRTFDETQVQQEESTTMPSYMY